MKIAGLAKTSFVDYPGKIACVVFTPGCNFNCRYCHNKHILGDNVKIINEKIVFDYLEKRKDLLGAVVITGGEPTIQKNLPEFIQAVRRFGLLVKLDTNGTNPALLRALIEENMLDYIAMDVKAPLEKYFETAGAPVDINAISSSIEIMINGPVPYEFRTTFAPMLEAEDIINIGRLIKGAKSYFLQQYKLVPGEAPAHSVKCLEETAERMRAFLGVCEVRGK